MIFIKMAHSAHIDSKTKTPDPKNDQTGLVSTIATDPKHHFDRWPLKVTAHINITRANVLRLDPALLNLDKKFSLKFYPPRSFRVL